MYKDYEVAKQCYELQMEEGLTNKEIIARTGLSERTIRRARSFYKKNFMTEGNSPASGYGDRLAQEDGNRYNNFMQSAAKLSPVLRVLIPNDIHFPYEDPYVLDLVLQVTQDFKPHIVVDGSDVFDFGPISRYSATPKEKAFDIWEKTLPSYTSWRKDLKSANDHLSVFVMGNHDERFLNWSRSEAAQLSTTLERVFVDAIRQTDTLWMGEGYDMVEIGALAVGHGWYTGEGTAKKTFQEVGYRHRTTIVGHIHVPQYYSKTTVVARPNMREVRETTEVYVTGCCCSLKPSYDNSRKGFNWAHSFAIATVDLKNNTVHVEDIKVHSDDYTLQWGGKLYKAKR